MISFPAIFFLFYFGLGEALVLQSGVGDAVNIVLTVTFFLGITFAMLYMAIVKTYARVLIAPPLLRCFVLDLCVVWCAGAVRWWWWCGGGAVSSAWKTPIWST